MHRLRTGRLDSPEATSKPRTSSIIQIILIALILTAVAVVAFSVTREPSHPLKPLNMSRSGYEARANRSQKRWLVMNPTTSTTTTSTTSAPSVKATAGTSTSRIHRVTTSTSAKPVTVPGDAKIFIYLHESGNDPTRHNSRGCRGLGQACPGSKLPCSDIDYACQDAWFTNYCMTRYGSWENAKAFWLKNRYW